MMKYRSRAEIISQMLEAAKTDLKGVTKTKIMYVAYLSYAQLKEYLKLVIDRDLLEYDTSSSRYKLTQRGLDYLEMFRQTRKMTEEI